MASRAHVIHDYSPVGPRPRRKAWYRSDSDPVVLPMQRARGSAGLVASALVAACLIGGAAYAAYYSAPAQLNETPTAPLERSFEPDREVFRATTFGLLQGPALAVTGAEADAPAAEPEIEAPEGPLLPPSEVPIAPQPRRELQKTVPAPPLPEQHAPTPPYPNPVTTPPDAIGPDLDLNKSAPTLDPENPY